MSNEKVNYQGVIELINQHQRIGLIMHERPDGDTVACSLALLLALRELGKQVSVVSKDPIPKPFQFLPGLDHIVHALPEPISDVLIVLDCGDLRRTGYPTEVREFAHSAKRLVHVDHHQKSDLYKLANYRLFDSSASATGQIIFQLLQGLGAKITAEIATCLLTSLYYDTGAFKHANTNPEVLSLAAQLMHQGAKLRQITEHVELTKSVPALRLWGIALRRVKRHPRLGVVSSLLTRADIKRSGASEDDIAGIVNLLNSVPGAKAALLLAETADGTIRASLRSESEGIDVSALASLFGGGGLKRASGFALKGSVRLEGDQWHVQLID